MAIDKRAKLIDGIEMAVAVTRFWDLVGQPNNNETNGVPCRDWMHTVNEYGYGVYSMNGQQWMAHELALTFATGEVRAEGLEGCHECDRPICVEPLHLRFDTRLSNVSDMINRGRSALGQWNRRLSDMQVAEIRERRSNGATCASLASAYGIESSYVSMLTTGRARTKAPGPISSPKSGAKQKRVKI